MARTDDTSLHFTCPRCLSWLKAPSSSANSRHRCPRCQLVIEVPQQSRKPVKDEGYGLQQEAGPLPAAQPAYIPVICHVCHTRMYAEEDQVGQRLVCPDCDMPTIVPRPAEKSAKKPRSADEIGQYALVNEVDRTTGETPAAQRSYVVACCSLCQTRLDVTTDQAGQTLVCPDCGRPVVVPCQPKDNAGAGQGRGASDTSSTWIEPPEPPTRPDFVPNRDYRDPEMVAEREAKLAEQERVARLATHRIPPLKLFFVDTFSFPFSQELLGRTLSLIATAILTPPLLGFAFAGGPVEAGGFADAAVWIGKMLFAAIGMGLLLTWIVTASAYGLAILRDTAYGNDAVRNYPNVLTLEGLTDSVYIIFAIIFGALPGVFIVRLWNPSEISELLGISISQLLFAPICLLSMLETNSLLNPLSLSIWRSVWRSWRAWALFYLLSFVIVTIVITLQAASVSLGGPALGIVVSGVVATIAWIAYFRLLGRLAWFCSGQQPPVE